MSSLFFLAVLSVLSFLLYYQTVSGGQYSADKLISVLVLAGLSVVIYLFRKEKESAIKKKYVTAFNIFLLSFLCVHFQRFIDVLVFGDSIIRSEIYSNKDIVLKSSVYCLMGLLSLIWGYLIGGLNTLQKSRKVNILITRKTYSALSYCYVITIAMFLYYNGSNYFSGPYSQEMLDMTKGTMSTYSVILVNCCMYSMTICNVLTFRRTNVSIKDYAKSFDLMYYLCGGTYMFLCLMLGDRGPLISFIMVYYFGYLFLSKRNMGFIKLVVLLFVASLTLNIIGLTRNSTEHRNISQYNSEIMDVKSVSPLTSELASSNRTVIYAVESTPARFPYRYGLFTMNNILSIIPFSSSLLRSLGLSSSAEYVHSSQFLTWYEQGSNPMSGVGSSTIADIYLDFGPVGIVIIMFILGFLFRKIDIMIFVRNRNDITLFGIVASIVIFSQAVYIPRSMLIPVLRTILWEYLFIWLVIQFTTSKKTR